MDAQTIVNIEDFKKEVAGSLNKYIDKVPAIVISDFLGKLGSQFAEYARQQYEQAQKLLAESEGKENGREKSNRADSE